MNWIIKLFEDPYKAEMRKIIKNEFNSKNNPVLDNVKLGCWVANKRKDDFLSVHGVYYHIGSKRKYQLLDFSSTVDGLCYIQDIETLEVGRCIKQQLKPIIR